MNLNEHIRNIYIFKYGIQYSCNWNVEIIADIIHYESNCMISFVLFPHPSKTNSYKIVCNHNCLTINEIKAIFLPSKL